MAGGEKRTAGTPRQASSASGPLDSAAHDLAELVPRLYRLLRTALDVDSEAPSLEQLRVLHRIDEGFETVSELATVRQMRMSALTAVVDALEARGWVTRRPDPDDRRRTRVALTRTGRAALRTGRRHTTRRMASVLEHYDGDAETLRAALESLSKAVGAREGEQAG